MRALPFARELSEHPRELVALAVILVVVVLVVLVVGDGVDIRAYWCDAVVNVDSERRHDDRHAVRDAAVNVVGRVA